jgi:hypothetical protein
MKNIWTVLCQNSSIDKENNTISLFNCIEELGFVHKGDKIEGKTILPISLQIVSLWVFDKKRKNNSFETRLEVLDPKEKVISFSEIKSEVPLEYPRFRSVGKIEGIPFTENGQYIFRLSKKESKTSAFESVSEIPVMIRVTIAEK